MSEAISDRAASFITGGVALVFSGAYVMYARNIEDSLLADSVGASGVPVMVGMLMGLASVGLLIKGAVTRATGDVEDDGDAASSNRSHLLAAGLLAILLGYVFLLPMLGYVVSIGLLVAAVAMFAGGRNKVAVGGMLLVTGPVLWLMFDMALKVRMPAGFWPQIFSG
ncbi:tripartite tricarboxylate transporter TctB family protein [Hydrogenophaga sp.]|uniref:tripartite tricarboxylate transporter TctB family protein n=1 Tax=Hydrogenophaga sp. TaxID=1904254 RepID=UPI0025C37764|nr:tripartite tricarboxylate transporter TctB family protein [Hydrogenophaga sp.]MBT9463303.1 tripartite tricarboxylate transporter TctB family protein [Hydrogenophaga sp.]